MTISDHKLIGVEIGGTKLQLVLADDRGHPEQTLCFAIDPIGGAAAIKKQLTAGWHQLAPLGTVTAIGVGFGGPVDWQSGRVQVSHQIDGWAGFDLGNWLQQLTGVPVAVDNDANVAALAEARFGAGKGYRTVFYITLGSGVGGGLVTNGAIYHGRTPGELEVGHLRLDRNGTTLESQCSGWAVDKKISELIPNQPDGLFARLSLIHNGPKAALLPEALAAGDKTAQDLLARVADDLAFALSHVVHLLHPDVLVIGGGLSALGERLLAPVRQQLPGYLMHAFQPAPPIAVAALGEQVVPLGALELARKRLHKQAETRTNSL